MIDSLNDSAWAFAWQVTAPLNQVTKFTVNDAAADPLAAWGDQALECIISHYKPAHSTVIFSYV